MPHTVDLSFVIPVFNGAASIGRVVEQIHELYANRRTIEIVLVNDGSADESEAACNALVERHPQSVRFVHLARNFGEHNAVLAGLHHTRGAHVAILDDDGQNPPEEVERLYRTCVDESYDIVYGRYRVKKHSLFRNIGSWFNDRAANLMLKKPKDLYLSSFKVINRFLVDEILRYNGAFPYIDGLVLRSTRSIGQIEVDHASRDGKSNYTLRRLLRLWLNMFLNFSIMPLRISAMLGVFSSVVSIFLLVAIVVDKLYINPDIGVGIPTVLVTIVFFAGVQLVILGTIGEYLGRLFMDQTRTPQFVVRYTRDGRSGPQAAQEREANA